MLEPFYDEFIPERGHEVMAVMLDPRLASWGRRLHAWNLCQIHL